MNKSYLCMIMSSHGSEKAGEKYEKRSGSNSKTKDRSSSKSGGTSSPKSNYKSTPPTQVNETPEAETELNVNVTKDSISEINSSDPLGLENL